MDLRLDVSERDGWTVLQIGGEVDVATAPKLREQLLALVNKGCYRIVVDLEEVDFIDSTGLGVLIGARKRVGLQEGDMKLVCTEARIIKVFEITGLNKVFEIHASVNDALTA